MGSQWSKLDTSQLTAACLAWQCSPCWPPGSVPKAEYRPGIVTVAAACCLLILDNLSLVGKGAFSDAASYKGRLTVSSILKPDVCNFKPCVRPCCSVAKQSSCGKASSIVVESCWTHLAAFVLHRMPLAGPAAPMPWLARAAAPTPRPVSRRAAWDADSCRQSGSRWARAMRKVVVRCEQVPALLPLLRSPTLHWDQQVWLPSSKHPAYNGTAGTAAIAHTAGTAVHNSFAIARRRCCAHHTCLLQCFPCRAHLLLSLCAAWTAPKIVEA